MKLIKVVVDDMEYSQQKKRFVALVYHNACNVCEFEMPSHVYTTLANTGNVLWAMFLEQRRLLNVSPEGIYFCPGVEKLDTMLSDSWYRSEPVTQETRLKILKMGGG
jgi:hypothetical protein